MTDLPPPDEPSDPAPQYVAVPPAPPTDPGWAASPAGAETSPPGWSTPAAPADAAAPAGSAVPAAATDAAPRIPGDPATPWPGAEPTAPVGAVDGDAATTATKLAARTNKKFVWRGAIEWLVIIAVALIGAVVIRTVLFQAYFIPSGSMEPTLDIHDRILVNKLAYDFHSVHRGDVVVFSRSQLRGIAEGNIKDLVKRVIGLPGDVIQSTPDGQVEIDGRILKEPYLPAGTLTFNLPRQTVPPGHYYVMGDNREDSADSRVFGPIPKSLIVGRAFILIWPVSRIGLL